MRQIFYRKIEVRKIVPTQRANIFLPPIFLYEPRLQLRGIAKERVHEIQKMILRFNKPHRLLWLLLLLPGSLFAQEPKAIDGYHDAQLWPDVNVSVRLRPDLALGLFSTLRLGREIHTPVNEQLGVGMTKILRKGLTTAAWYRYNASQPLPGRSSREHRLFADLTPRLPLKWGFQMSDRNRIEWRNINHDISWRYRNRVQIERPLSIHDHRLIPYASAETYYDNRFHTLSRSQVFVGSRVPLTRHVSLDGFYMRQFDARSRPGFLHVMGMLWRIEY